MDGNFSYVLGPKQTETETKLSVIEASKRLAAYTAVDHHIRKEHKVSLVVIC